MPLLSLEDLGNAAPLLHGKIGCTLMRLLSVDKINDLYDRNVSLVGPDFTSAVLHDIGVSYEVLNPEVLGTLPDGPFITISNHPYGALDGVMLVDLFARIRPDFKVMANRILSRIEPLAGNFISVVPTGVRRGTPAADSIHGVKSAVAHVRAGHPLGIFPAGAVSDLSIRDGCVRDREWQEPVLRLVWKLGVPVVPVHFLDGNSFFYYSLGLVSWKVRLLRLPAEVFNKGGRTERIALGEVIFPQLFEGFDDIGSFGEFLRKMVDNQY